MYTNKIGDATGENTICEMWKNHFSNLYNCIPDDGSKSHFYAKCSSDNNLTTQSISVPEVLDAIKLQRKAKVLDLILCLWSLSYMVVLSCLFT